MGTSLFLAKVMGVYIIIKGIMAVIKKKDFRKLAEEFAINTSLRYFASLLISILGLLVVFSHNIWSGWQAIITVLGYLMVIEAVVFMLISKNMAQGLIEKINKNAYYYSMSAVAILLGVYLLSKGFSWV